jgi:hypothetical protein
MLASFLWTRRSDETRQIFGNFQSDSTLGSPLRLEYVPFSETDPEDQYYTEGSMNVTSLRMPPLEGRRVDLELCGDQLFQEIRNNWPVEEVDGSLQLLEPHALEIEASSDRPLDLRIWPATGQQVVLLPHERGPISLHALGPGSNYRFAFVFDSAPFQLRMRTGQATHEVQGRAEVGEGNRLCWTLQIPSGKLPENEPLSYDSAISLYGTDDSFLWSDGATEMTLRYATAKLTLDDKVIEASTSSIYIRFREYGKFFFSTKGLRLEGGVADSVKINGQEQIKRGRNALIPSLPNLISAMVGAAIAVVLTHDARKDSGKSDED